MPSPRGTVPRPMSPFPSLTAPLRRLARRAFDLAWRRQGHEPIGRSLRAIPDETPYDRWLNRARAETPVYEGLVVDDVRSVPLKPWPAMGPGVSGLYVRLADYQMTDAFILELPPRAAASRRQHLFEMGVYFLGGPGHTIVELPGGRAERIDWHARGLYSVPLNVPYRHVNDSASPIRLLAVTSLPFVLNATGSDAFVFENPFVFGDRGGRHDGGRGDPVRTGRLTAAVDLVPDVAGWALERDEYRGPGNTNLSWEMSGNTMLSMHASEMPAGRRKKAHRHTSDAFILLLSGSGYSVTWPDGAYEKRVRVDWHEGTLFVPPTYWYHQHFNPGTSPARYLAISARGLTRNLGLRFSDQLEEDLPDVADEWRREKRRQQARGWQT